MARPGGRSSVSGIVATVFGCSGFLGRFVVNHLGRIGSQVIAPYRGDSTKVRHLKLAGDLGQIVPIPMDMTDLETVHRAVARSNVVINLIGSSTETSNYSYDDVHGKVAYRLAQVSKAAGVERFIHVSAVGADPNSESSFFRSKAAGEEAVREFYPDATILRPTAIFGPKDRFLTYYAYVGQRVISLPMARQGERELQPVFVGDVARAVLNAIADPSTKGLTYELGGPMSLKEVELLKLVSEHTLSDIRPLMLSDTLALAYGKVIGGRFALPMIPRKKGAMSTVLKLLDKLTISSVYHPDMVYQSHTDLVVDPALPGLADLGIDAPMPLEAQISRVLWAHRSFAPDRFPVDAKKLARDTHNITSN